MSVKFLVSFLQNRFIIIIPFGIMVNIEEKSRTINF